MKHQIQIRILTLICILGLSVSNAIGVIPVTPNASSEARMVFKYLQEQFGKKILAAQHGAQKQYEYVHDVTGKYAAIWGTDLIFSNRNDRLMNETIGWWAKGVIPTVMWHWGAPTLGEGYEQSKGKIDVNRCFESGTPENVAMWADLKRIADNLTILRDAKVPVLWRPLHECSGGWFWWDKSGGEAFKKLWITMFDYFSKERGLNNLIWVLGYDGSPSAEYDPGKAYYDIVGSDNYDKSIGSHLNMYDACVKLVGNSMPVAFHECGLPPDPVECKKDNAMWSWFMVWDSFIQKVDTTHLKNVYNSDLVTTLDELPNWAEMLKGKNTPAP